MSLAVMWLRNWSGTTYHVDISVLQAWFWKPTTSAATAMRRESILRCTCFLVKCQRFTDQINDMYVLELYLFIILKLYLFMILNLYLFLYENISEIIKKNNHFDTYGIDISRITLHNDANMDNCWNVLVECKHEVCRGRYRMPLLRHARYLYFTLYTILGLQDHLSG